MTGRFYRWDDWFVTIRNRTLSVTTHADGWVPLYERHAFPGFRKVHVFGRCFSYRKPAAS